jgi:hypothetical protein
VYDPDVGFDVIDGEKGSNVIVLRWLGDKAIQVILMLPNKKCY